jgi:hypothetical protein
VYARGGEGVWPASFTQTERRKLLLADDRIAKFEGLGRAGRAALARARSLADAGLAPSPRDEGDGWLSYPREGLPLAHEDLDADILDRLARYCAMRPSLCPAVVTTARVTQLEEMTEKNLEVAFGPGARMRYSPSLAVHRPAVVDGRMAPHEWLRRADRTLRKSDGVAHGDDHFFPGPTDIAWDLAGTIVEWRLGPGATERFVEFYERLTGDDPRPRLGAWIRAYSAFRLAFTTVGMNAARGTREEGRLARDAAGYRSFASSAAAAM